MEQGNVEQLTSVSEPQENQAQQATTPSSPPLPQKSLVIAGILLGFVLFGVGGYVLGMQRGSKTNKLDNIPAPTQSPAAALSQETLQINEDNIAEGEGEIAYLQNGKIWLISKDLAKKMEYKSTESTDTIINFDFSPDGQQLYWLTEAGELWKKDKSEESNPLVTQVSDMTSATFEDPITKTITTYQKGEVTTFHLSPGGQHIAYETLETFTGCCMSPYDIPVHKIRIMKNDGTSKTVLEKPLGVTRPMLFFDGWFSSDQKILFHFSAPDEATQGSPLYEVDIDGKSPVKFVGIDFDEFGNTITVAGAVPVFSSDGEKMVYLEGGIVGEGKLWLSNIDGTDKRALTIDGGHNFTDFNWSKNGSLLLVNSVGKFIIFNQQADVVYQTSVEQVNKIEGIRSVISPDNKYVAVSSADKLLVININTEEKKELNIANSNDQTQIYPQFITESGRFYYLKDTNQETNGLYPQLWMIDTVTLKNYKIADNASLVKDVP